MGKPTVHDIAREAGVSLATVDRVLNARPGVRAKTVARVQDAVARLGYVRDLSAANLARGRQYSFAVILPGGSGQFVVALRAALREAADAMASERIVIRPIPVPAHDPHAVVRAIDRIRPNSVDGVAIMAPETPQVRDAVARLKAAKLAVVTLVSDLPNSERDHFVGINNLAAGQTAGVLMGRFLGPGPAKVLVIASSMLARDSLDRRLGFDNILLERFPNITALPSLESRDAPDRLKEIVSAALRAHPDVRGIYGLGTGVKALLETLAAHPAERVVILHELTPQTRAGLLSGAVDAVITQDTGHLVRSALRVLRARVDGRDVIASQERIRIEIVLRENLL